ncbi:hypothetical protein V6N12_024438 [Hibiscus sabdariffa]|uniref:Uncharacterized protein n=1 Tax=Hibiscus sabdariffa TaxID=183260 RepID=A0ABR2G1A6_9ROSI
MSYANPNSLSTDIPIGGLPEPSRGEVPVCHQENLLQILHCPILESPCSPIDNSLFSNPKRARNALDAFIDVVENDILYDFDMKKSDVEDGNSVNEMDDEIYLADDDVIVSQDSHFPIIRFLDRAHTLLDVRIVEDPPPPINEAVDSNGFSSENLFGPWMLADTNWCRCGCLGKVEEVSKSTASSRAKKGINIDGVCGNVHVTPLKEGQIPKVSSCAAITPIGHHLATIVMEEREQSRGHSRTTDVAKRGHGDSMCKGLCPKKQTAFKAPSIPSCLNGFSPPLMAIQGGKIRCPLIQVNLRIQ